MAKAKVYIETTIISYLTAFASRDIIRAAHQQVTREWWDLRGEFDLYTSEVVVREAGVGDPVAAQARLAALADIPVLSVSEEAIHLAQALLRGGGLPAKAAADALHVAVAASREWSIFLHGTAPISQTSPCALRLKPSVVPRTSSHHCCARRWSLTRSSHASS